ncbi:hypothetical protein BTO04_08050 [Polaribacter sp. SA4-10]|uniref:FG-GAP-like repeat-containing protein n=1 Tax=Polaribacter sp. SA4-10 TaxID=754397 RepID=UPI000B567022|nr:FG-GAP-like repeat-containing protein [Polaribacter sp. SA4-10]ARV06651.1 hypothetical protein BTO04_08050 [Polaribacter sp. SA4-10]
MFSHFAEVNAQTLPTISSFTPLTGDAGETVTITGTNFNTIPANNILFFGATKATVSAVTATSLTVTVPAGATYGPLTLVDLSVNKTINSKKFFTPTYSPSKGVLTPADFSTEQSFSTGTTEPSKIAATGDLDGDGKPDIIIAEGSGTNIMLILRNTGGNGTASFETALGINTGGYNTSLAVGDIDADGKLDIVEVNYNNNSYVKVYLNTTAAIGSISFADPINLITGVSDYKLQNVAISDLDGDGKADIAVVYNDNTSNDTSKVFLFRNTGSVGTVSFTKFEFGAGIGPKGIMIGDIDSDGLPDLAITSKGTSIRVLRNTSTSGTLNFVNSGDFTIGGTEPTDLALGDLDGDGKLDIATVNFYGENVSVLLNTSTNGTVSFANKTDFAIGSRAKKIALGDLNGDGKLDVVVTQSGAAVFILTNTTTTAGTVTFDPKIDILSTGTSLQAMILDLDGDGKTDFATGGSKKIVVFSNGDPLKNADLEALSISEATLSPTFTPSTTAYTASSVSNTITSITVTPTQTQSNETATIQVRVNDEAYTAVASGAASDPLDLNVGANTIDVKVTSPDGTTIKNYGITVTRELPVPSYMVSGAGTTAVNGLYVYFGKNNSNKQVWQYGSYYLTSNGYNAWIGTSTSSYYSSQYSANAYNKPSPLDWNMSRNYGADPAPIIELAAPKVTYASSTFIENSTNNGAVTATTTITHNNYESATFTGADGEDFVTSGKAVVTGVPTGLTAVITRDNNLQLTFSLTGNASAHANANDLNNLTITFQDAAFSDSDAANTTNYATNLSINFIEQINVGSGETYTTIQSAIDAAGNGDVLLLAAQTFTEQNITITNKSLSIIGVSPASTIVQAHAVAGSATDRVFNITHSSYAETNFNSFEKLTIRHGNVANSNGNDRGGALFVYHTTLKLKDCAIESNRVGTTGWGGYGVGGAGVYVQISNFISENSTYYDNHHTSESRPGDMMGGGAIAFFPNDQVNYMEITNSTFSDNSSGNAGGAIMNRPTVTNDIRITNSTFVGNSAPYGGAYMQMGSGANPQPIYLTNSLFYGNTAPLGGSQMYSEQATNWTVNNCLIENTSSGGLAGVYTDCIVGEDPLLGTLADNGGFTKTYSIGAGSPAINSGTTTSLLLDQRGFSIVGTRDIGSYEYSARESNTFTANGNWSENGNWSNGNPSENQDVIIADNVSVTLDVDDISMYNFTLNTGASLVIPKDKELTILGNFTTNGSLSLESDGADSGVLLIEGATSGTITYKRGGLLANKWSIVSPPVSGQEILSFAENADNNIRTNTTVAPVKYAIASYDSSQSNDAWKYYTAATPAAEEFLQGESYSISRVTDGEVSFTGSLNINDISKNLTANRWSAIGNPYTTYLAANKNGNSSFLNDNLASLHDTFKGIYIWDNAQEKYIAVTEVDTNNRSFAPGQGFFIKMKENQSNISFNKDKRQLKPATGTTVFEKNQTTVPEIVVSVSNSSVTVKTNIKYFDTATTGLDPGYDIGNFNGASLDIFTHLIEDGNAVNYTIQSLPKYGFEDVIIPLGIKTDAGTELTFTADSIDLPTDLQVFIEDRVLNVFTALNDTSSYTINIDSDMNGIGRFYIHTAKTVLSTNNAFGLNNVMLYVKDATTLSVSGLTGGQTKLKLYSLVGKQILKTTFEGSGEREVSIPSLSVGVYLVQLQTKEGKLIKKIILE